MSSQVDSPPAERASGDADAVTREQLTERVRHYALLRAAHRALSPPSRELLSDDVTRLVRAIREQLRTLTAHFDDGSSRPPPPATALRAVDRALGDYRQRLLRVAERMPPAKLRASLSNETHAQRVEASALLQICLEDEPAPARHLRTVDLMVTLLASVVRDGSWVMEFDPADLNAVVRERCGMRSALDPSAETPIVLRFQQAAEALVRGDDGVAITREMADYKLETAPFYFAPSVLRSIVAYNVAARNHFQDHRDRGRERDDVIDGELGLFAPLLDQDPHAARGAAGLPAHEAPGVIAVEHAIRERVRGRPLGRGPAERIAADLDLEWLEPTDRDAFLDPRRDGIPSLIRTTVVLGQLALSLDDHASDLAALSIREAELDAWICAIGEQAQREVDTLIRANEYDGAVRLGQTKSRFLAAARVVARRRAGRAVTRPEEIDTFHLEALGLLREYLERERLRYHPRAFFDLFGGGWRRSAAFAAVGLVVAFFALPELVPNRDPRRIDELEGFALRDVSSLLESGYRDHAANGSSMFIATLSDRWSEIDARERRLHAEHIRDRALERGIAEVLLFDGERVLLAHWVAGRWRDERGLD